MYIVGFISELQIKFIHFHPIVFLYIKCSLIFSLSFRHAHSAVPHPCIFPQNSPVARAHKTTQSAIERRKNVKYKPKSKEKRRKKKCYELWFPTFLGIFSWYEKYLDMYVSVLDNQYNYFLKGTLHQTYHLNT